MIYQLYIETPGKPMERTLYAERGSREELEEIRRKELNCLPPKLRPLSFIREVPTTSPGDRQ